MTAFDIEYEKSRESAEKALEGFFKEKAPQGRLLESMRYSLLAGGKRVRPILVMKFCEACGGNEEDALAFACAIEMLHTYSLIHDDLPCMDNDTLRRGKPTNHVVFGECTAVLAGDALLTAAFETLLKAKLPPEKCVAAGIELAKAAGAMGMCGGQYLDMDGEGKALTADMIEAIHAGKTAALIRAAAKMGVIAGGGTEKQLEAAEKYAEAVGLAFQLRDDLLDITATSEELGKSAGKDAESEKSTFVTVYGIDGCERMIAQKTEEAKAAVAGA